MQLWNSEFFSQVIHDAEDVKSGEESNPLQSHGWDLSDSHQEGCHSGKMNFSHKRDLHRKPFEKKCSRK